MKKIFFIFAVLFLVSGCKEKETKEPAQTKVESGKNLSTNSGSNTKVEKKVNTGDTDISTGKDEQKISKLLTGTVAKQNTGDKKPTSTNKEKIFEIKNNKVYYKNYQLDVANVKNIKTKGHLLTDGKKTFLENIELNFIKSNFNDLNTYSIFLTGVAKTLDDYNFIADKNKIYYNFCQKDYNDNKSYQADSFNYKGLLKYHSGYFMDSQNVYSYNYLYGECGGFSFALLSGVEASKFKIVGDSIGIYSNSLYIDNYKVGSIDSSKLKFYKKMNYGGLLGDDKNQYFYSMGCSQDGCNLPRSSIIKINNIDMSTFKFIGILQPEEGDSFVPIVYYDKNGISVLKFTYEDNYDNYNYSYTLQKLDIQNPTNFKVIQLNDVPDAPYDIYYFDRLIGNDGSAVYYLMTKYDTQNYSNKFSIVSSKIPGVDAPTFEYIKGGYAKDKNNFYFFENDVYKLDGVDRNTFSVISYGDARDKNHTYKGIKKISK